MRQIFKFDLCSVLIEYAMSSRKVPSSYLKSDEYVGSESQRRMYRLLLQCLPKRNNVSADSYDKSQVLSCRGNGIDANNLVRLQSCLNSRNGYDTGRQS